MKPHEAETCFLQAAADLLEVAISQAMERDPRAAAGLDRLLRNGGLLSLRATLAPSTGLAQLAVEVISPSGVTHQLMATSLERMAVQ